MDCGQIIMFNEVSTGYIRRGLRELFCGAEYAALRQYLLETVERER